MIVVKKNAAEPRERLLVIETALDPQRGFMFLLIANDGRFTEEEATACMWISGRDTLGPDLAPIAMPIPSGGAPR